MKNPRKTISVVWLGMSIFFALLTGIGGDSSIIFGSAFWLITLPFSAIWWGCIYDTALVYMPAEMAYIIGSIFMIFSAYFLWFIGIPMVLKKTYRGASK